MLSNNVNDYCYLTAFDLNNYYLNKTPVSETKDRRRSGVWRIFFEISQNGVTRAKCDACGFDVVANPEIYS